MLKRLFSYFKQESEGRQDIKRMSRKAVLEPNEYGIRYDVKDKFEMIKQLSLLGFYIVAFAYNKNIIWFASKTPKQVPQGSFKATLATDEYVIDVLNEDFSSMLKQLKDNEFSILATKKDRRTCRIWFN